MNASYTVAAIAIVTLIAVFLPLSIKGLREQRRLEAEEGVREQLQAAAAATPDAVKQSLSAPIRHLRGKQRGVLRGVTIETRTGGEVL